MGRVQEQVAAVLAAEVASRARWDEPPALYFLYLEAGRCRVSALPLPAEVWALDAPPRVLSRLADGSGEFSGLLQAVAPEGLHGAGFRCEAWLVTGGKPGTARASEVAAASLARKLHLHPDRVESRCMYAVDRAGTTYSVMQARGEAEVERSVHYRKPGQAEVSGIIPAALDRIVISLLGVEFPARAGR